MTLITVSLLVSYGASVGAVSIPSIHNDNLRYAEPSTTTKIAGSHWSRQDVLTSISIGIAMLGILVAVLVATPSLREWCCKPFACKLNPSPFE
jgi:hypothetical protein